MPIVEAPLPQPMPFQHAFDGQPGSGYMPGPSPPSHTQPIEPMPGRQVMMPAPGSDGLGQFPMQVPGLITSAGDIGAQVIAGEAAAMVARQQGRISALQPQETTVLGFPVSGIAKMGIPLALGGLLVWLWLRNQE